MARSTLRLLLAAALATGGAVAVAAPAKASCVDGDGTDCLYYSANGTGARVAVTGNIPCYDWCTVNYVFNDATRGSAGLGQAVRNNTHYVYNNSYCTLAIYVSPNYGGAADYFDFNGGLGGDGEPAYWYGNLNNTLNNDASQAEDCG